MSRGAVLLQKGKSEMMFFGEAKKDYGGKNKNQPKFPGKLCEGFSWKGRV